MRINGKDIMETQNIFGKMYMLCIYIYMLKMFHVYIIFIDCTLLSDISCGYYLTPKKQKPCSDYLVLEFLVFLWCHFGRFL